jgi:hypothetical protein
MLKGSRLISSRRHFLPGGEYHATDFVEAQGGITAVLRTDRDATRVDGRL